MKKIAGFFLLFCIAAVALVFFAWSQPSQIKHYTAKDLVGLTCAELSARHDDFIFAYHDAEIANYRRTDGFHDDLGLPQEETLPFIVLMRWFMQDNDIIEADLVHSSFPSKTLHGTKFYYEISAACASASPMRAVDVMQQVATKLNLIDPAVSP
ncbi:hypothetical protein PXK30_22145 [Phaeobacter gallaeciensis]|uniref:hypothetical protein n=1 Tax=Phaeobacter gallaeciensis TaxID=60890 RepID=UPI00237F7359|nr:hypothetical protein [Phaeobacter gallaeciensis]MDE4306341.1 hypothetical protein [Phaeobacter gallaeciensis]MDE4310790.1 hypothetical protein [Phaeobacter gallaeciensis]MDE4315262.1 hypothetical protein [Phaeobacter gallaeciensis]MDE4319734.1 hypothetical protein [Phaeobacter gallaeciensis]MDE4324181.1 hypothetical protein [Phaeobacter gallaeciensis]